MSNFMGVGIFWIRLNLADLGCWRLTSNIKESNCDFVMMIDPKNYHIEFL